MASFFMLGWRLARTISVAFLACHALQQGTLPAAELVQRSRADELRALAPQLDAPMLESLKRERFAGISRTWSELSFEVDAPPTVPTQAWTGVTGYGTPVAIDGDTIAVIEKQRGIAFTLWHLDPEEPSIKLVANINHGAHAAEDAAAGAFDKVLWHKKNGDIIGEFLTVTVTENEQARFDGHIRVGSLNLRTGGIVSNTVHRLRMFPDEARLRTRLVEKYQLPDASLELPPAAAVFRQFAERLSGKGVFFDFRRGRYIVLPEVKKRLEELAADVVVACPEFVDAIANAMKAADKTLTCAAIRDLRLQLELAQAVATRDEKRLEAIAFVTSAPAGIDDQRFQIFRELAAYERLRLEATGGDALDEYARFAVRCDERLQGPQNAAILRMHEILFRKACEEATVEAFDAFLDKAPIAIQAPRAREFAYELEKERIDRRLATEGEGDSIREGIARGLYVDWRAACHEERYSAAERCSTLLSKHDKLKSTLAAVMAQDAEDERRFRASVLAHYERQERAIARISDAQARQLEVMNKQLAESKAANAGVGVLNVQVEYLLGSVRQLGESAESSRQGIDAIHRLLKK